MLSQLNSDTVNTFCDSERMSLSQYYNMKKGSSGKRVGESDGECGLKAYGYWVFGVS